jgi:tRNA-specific 2-thiouridylase
VGPREELTVDHITAFRPRWCGTVPTEPLQGTVQLRAHGEEHRATVTVTARSTADDAGSPTEDEVVIELHEPAQGIAPGQAAVVYDGTRVVGSATITGAVRRERQHA